ncbi:MAG TPA: alpha/beta hydrolase [Gemmatimonadaceae bacterium]|nr:alpha/beta hydrolase [Gemmatimonadaceae bacterium]
MRTFTHATAALAVGLVAVLATPVAAQVAPLPAGFRVQEIPTNGTTLHVRIGGKGPAVLLQHGYGETGDMWVALARKLSADHMVIIPDLRGMGLSAITKGGYDKKTQGHDLAGVLDALKVQQVDLVTHDIGNMVGYAFAAEYPTRVRRFVLIDAPIPGVGPWAEITANHKLWHFSFWGPDEDRLVAGRERIWLDRFYNEFSFNPKTVPEATRAHYAAIYAKPGRMHAGFEQFRAFDQDAIDDKAFMAQGKLTMPVLAIGADHSFGAQMAEVMRFAASNVTQGIVPNSGHWIMEENPTATIALVTGFLSK